MSGTRRQFTPNTRRANPLFLFLLFYKIRCKKGLKVECGLTIDMVFAGDTTVSSNRIRLGS